MSNAHTGYLILVGLLGVIFPALSMLSARRTKEILIAEPDKKVLVYRQTFSMLWVFTGLILLAMWWVGDAIHLIGLSFLNRPLPIIGLLFLGLAFLRLTMHLKLSEKTTKMVVQAIRARHLSPTGKPGGTSLAHLGFVYRRHL